MVVEGEKTLICTMAVSVINNVVKFAKPCADYSYVDIKVCSARIEYIWGRRCLAALSLNFGAGW